MIKKFSEHSLNENADLARIRRVMRSRPFAMMSAFRGQYTLEENKARMLKLYSMINSLGYEFIRTEGGWVEDGETEMTEDSVFIIGDEDEDISKFVSVISTLSNTFDQEAFIYGDTETVWQMWQDGKVERLGSTKDVNTTDIGQFYSKVGDTKFVFTLDEHNEDDSLDKALAVIDMTDIDTLVETIDLYLAEFGVYVTETEAADVAEGDVLFGGSFDSMEDADGNPAIEVEVFYNPDTTKLNPDLAERRIYMLRSVLLHEMRHQYQWRARDYEEPDFHKKGYLANPDEIDAHAIDIANDLFREYGARALRNLSSTTELAISRNEDGELVSTSLYAYIKEFTSSHPVVKRLIKKVYKNLEDIMDRVKAGQITEVLYNFVPTTQWFKDAPLFHITTGKKAESIVATNSFKLSSMRWAWSGKSPEEKISPKQYRTSEHKFMSLAYDLNNSFSRNVIKLESGDSDIVAFELDGGLLSKDFPLWKVDYRKAFPVFGWIVYGNEKEIRLFSKKDTIEDALQYVKQVHVMLHRSWDFYDVLREYLIKLVDREIPVYIYTNRGAFLKRNTKRAKKFTDKRFKRINRYKINK